MAGTNGMGYGIGNDCDNMAHIVGASFDQRFAAASCSFRRVLPSLSRYQEGEFGMDAILKTLATGVLALVGLLVIVALFLFHPTWIVPVMVMATFLNMGILLYAAR
jgi:hypothetical protein